MTPVAQSNAPPVRAVFKMLAAFAMLTLIGWVLFAFVSMIAGVGIVAPAIEDHSLEGFRLFVAVPYLIFFGSLSGSGLLIYYFLLIVAIAASLTWILTRSAGDFFKELSMKAKPREHSPIFEICALMFATLFLNFVIIIVTGAANSSTPTPGSPGTPTSELLFSLANASVWEELVVRVLFIGIPLLFIDLVRRKTRKDWHAYLLGGKFKIGIPETVLIVFSAALFGVAHYLGGWGEWKIPAAGIAGLAFGYLFLRFGLAASITLHFTFDYLSAPTLVFPGSDLTLEFVLGLLAMLWLAAGAAFTVYYLMRIVEQFSGARFWEPRREPAPYPFYPGQVGIGFQQPQPYPPYTQAPNQPWYPPPPQMPTAFGGYVCPACGNLEARWVNGRFQCLRCGHLS